jgi:hypothetical protein
MAETEELWERMTGESAKQYERFCKYRDMKHLTPTSNRSLRKLAKELGIRRQTIEELSVKFNWVARAEAYDLDLARQIREQNEAEIMEMRKNHALLASQMIKKAAKRLLTMPEEEITASDIVRLVDVGVKIERLSRGESTENKQISGEAKITHQGEVKVRSPGDLNLSSLSDEELLELEQLLEKLHTEPGV